MLFDEAADLPTPVIKDPCNKTPSGQPLLENERSSQQKRWIKISMLRDEISHVFEHLSTRNARK